MFFTRHMLDTPHELRLMIHHANVPPEVARRPRVTVHQADLADPTTLKSLCDAVDCVIHFAGVLFRPHPRRFLPRTNLMYVQHLAAEAVAAGVRRFILISFPHVEGESTPANPVNGTLNGSPDSIHAQTRLAAERYLFQVEETSDMQVIILRTGMIYGRGVLLLEAARWLMRRRLLPIWKADTWIHLLSLPDFLTCVQASVEGESIRGIFNLGDDAPLTLQTFLDRIAQHWGYPLPIHAPRWTFYFAAWMVEMFASLFRTTSPITRDFIRIGMTSYSADTSRMKRELLASLSYPTLEAGIHLL